MKQFKALLNVTIVFLISFAIAAIVTISIEKYNCLQSDNPRRWYKRSCQEYAAGEWIEIGKGAIMQEDPYQYNDPAKEIR